MANILDILEKHQMGNSKILRFLKKRASVRISFITEIYFDILSTTWRLTWNAT